MKIKILILILILLFPIVKFPIVESQNYIEVNAGDVIVPHLYDWYFDGIDDYVVIGLQPDGSGTPFTIYGWSAITIVEKIYPFFPKPSTTYSQFSMFGDRWGDNVGTSILTDNYNEYTYIYIFFTCRKPDGTKQDYAYNIFNYRNSWVEIARVFDATREYSLFVNGNKKYNESVPSDYKTILEWNPNTAYNPNRFKRFVLGANVEFGERMKLSQSYLLIYNRSLSSEEIANIRNINTTGLVVYLDPTIYTSGKYVDLSGNGNDGIPYNGVQRIKAETKYLSILKGLRNDGKAYIIMPPQSTLKIIVGTEEVKRVYCNELQEIVIPIGKYKYAIDENDTIILYVTPLILSGNTPLNNCSIEVFTDKINVVKTRSDNKIEILNAEGYLLTYVYGGVIQRYNITSDVLILDPQKVLNQWTIYAVPGVAIIITASPKIETNPFINISDIVNFYESSWGFLTYAIVLLLPVSVYLRTKSPGGAALTLLFAAAGGVALVPAFRPIGILLIIGAIAFLLYKVFFGE
ncbi:MAG: hypothetical protein QXW27_05065 [Candidatus Methanomethylicaceae archaeon]